MCRFQDAPTKVVLVEPIKLRKREGLVRQLNKGPLRAFFR